MTADQFAFDYEAREHARTSDPDTSHEAAGRLTTMNSHCAALLRSYAGHPGGLTAEKAGEYAGLDAYAASKRNSDLRRLGMIDPMMDGAEVVKRENSSGRRAVVYRINATGREAIR
ncbi:hypothetical protein AVT46_gp43 [Mycobacterium phage MOOREtheMARYer]|uniref:Helix-turn-helix DNA binding domain protein n=1 Tax=Mycobacterium phage MOOREtheMARYer TaxID=1647309 RepID=A0A0F6WEK8_9CAUD|nr:hypothetical protein AVT46_gp43 [Mycobacterium phage MOOREtheMARYer]AKF14904.1 hypothetical protein SEA_MOORETHEMARYER_43 [Mycobacterium phage MOOREtheMARYer]